MTSFAEIERIIDASHIGTYPSGHTGAQIHRFRRVSDGSEFVAKCCDSEDTTTVNEIRANYLGYMQIARIGGDLLIPDGLQLVELPDMIALVMADMGQPLSHSNNGILSWSKVSDSMTRLSHVTMRDIPSLHGGMVADQAARFHAPRDLVEKMRSVPPDMRSALMILDFTPDNVFETGSRIKYIDPWNQDSFLGSPGVSLGQFAALVRVYGLRDADKCKDLMRETAMSIARDAMGLEGKSGDTAFRLGQALQLTLSAHVRHHTDPSKAAEFRRLAESLWDD